LADVPAFRNLGGGCMRTYIVRVYDGDPESDFRLGGVVESVENQDYQIFESLEGLCRIVGAWSKQPSGGDADGVSPDDSDVEKASPR
jgi:hypothetical protein